MPIFQSLLVDIPTVPLGCLIIFGAVAAAILGLVIVRRLVPRQILKAHHEMTGAIFGALGLAYTVLLAFVVVVAWQNFDKAKTNIETEANCLVDLHRNSAAFPEPFRGEVRALLEGYVDAVIGDEWSKLATGEESMKARELLRKIWGQYTAFEPKQEKEKIFLAESVSKLDDLREVRRLRITEARTGIHPVLWFILVAGGGTMVAFTFFYGAESFMAHALMASILASFIALILFTILLFDFPFAGVGHIGPEVFREIVNF